VRARRRLPAAPWRHVAADALIVSTRRALKVSEKDGLSVYGLGRFPVTLYNEQWTKLLDMTDDIRAFIRANEASLKTKR